MNRDEPPFETEESDEDGALVLTVRGELDLETAPTLRERLRAAIAKGRTQLIVDVAGLAFIDSTGISVLVDAMKQARRQDGSLVLRDPTPGTRRVLEIAGLLGLFGLENHPPTST
jgi:anti-anti-sigma factor